LGGKAAQSEERASKKGEGRADHWILDKRRPD
jgi:hypothetical protein